MNFATTISRGLVATLLRHPADIEWSLQGFGMLRAYLTPDKSLRLHVWHSLGRTPEVSMLHDHPWDFKSVILAGRIVNTRFTEGYGEPFLRQTIRCGPGGCVIEPGTPTQLQKHEPEVYGEGAMYAQLAHEVHRSDPDDGTVTIIERIFGTNTEFAHVYFKERWVSAEPRAATREEVAAITQAALRRLEGEC